ncbi:MAG: DNA repair protein RadC [Rhodobacteraceae bacterium]|nr:MAG: DNA repair protein RadC [Paracoccaceae bacterium]
MTPNLASTAKTVIDMDRVGALATVGRHDRADPRRHLRERVLLGGAVGIEDRELLELILSRVAAQAQVQALAQRLIRVFGDFNKVVAAPTARLLSVAGVTAEMVAELKLVESCAHRMVRARISDKPVLSGWQALLDYCHTVMAHRQTEQFRVLFLDRKNRLIADEALGEGTVDHVPVYPREVVRRALELNATALILVHNHPSGDPSPSDADITMTHLIRVAAEALCITLHDHLVIGSSSEVSFRAEGLL